MELLDDEEREHVTAIQLQQWRAAPDAGRWSHKAELEAPRPVKVRIAA